MKQQGFFRLEPECPAGILVDLAPLPQRIEAGLADVVADRERHRAFEGFRPRVAAARARYPDIQRRIRAIKQEALDHLDELVATAAERLRANGCIVIVASDAAAARDYIRSVVTGGLVVKSKSNASKEIAIVDALEANGVRVIETDLGDRINQLNGTYGGHVIAPAIQIPQERVRELMSALAGEALPDDPEQMVAVARTDLRSAFAAAGYGLSGCNALAAETGTVCVVENEGNIRMLSTLPRVHVAVVPISKIVRTLEDALTVIQGASIFGVGMALGTYASCIGGPAPASGFGPEEVHVVLVDNGRRRAVAEGYAEAFDCINCGSCLDHCPVYGVIGDKYGVVTHFGGIGLLQASFTKGLDLTSRQGLSLCLNCRACVDPCPANIDTPGMHTRLRERVPAADRLPPMARAMLSMVRSRAALRAAGTALYAAEHLGLRRLATPMLPRRLREVAPLVPSMPSPREMAPPPEEISPIGPHRHTVAFFTGCIMSTWLAPITWATLRVLARSGCLIRIPRAQGCCGALHHHMGEGNAARDLARGVIEAMDGLSDCEAILTNSAGCGAAMKEYAELLRDGPALAGRARGYGSRVCDVTEYLARSGLPEFLAPIPKRAVYFDPCHLGIAQGIQAEPRALLRAIPDLEVVEAHRREACCGSAGIYNLVHPDVSGRLADLLVRDLLAVDPDIIVTANPGCLLQARWGLMRAGAAQRPRVAHVMELLDEATGVHR
jgi:L-lactate dehydrogenase complex protein LldF